MRLGVVINEKEITIVSQERIGFTITFLKKKSYFPCKHSSVYKDVQMMLTRESYRIWYVTRQVFSVVS